MKPIVRHIIAIASGLLFAWIYNMIFDFTPNDLTVTMLATFVAVGVDGLIEKQSKKEK
jgi:hypothetical protein